MGINLHLDLFTSPVSIPRGERGGRCRFSGSVPGCPVRVPICHLHADPVSRAIGPGAMWNHPHGGQLGWPQVRRLHTTVSWPSHDPKVARWLDHLAGRSGFPNRPAGRRLRCAPRRPRIDSVRPDSHRSCLRHEPIRRCRPLESGPTRRWLHPKVEGSRRSGCELCPVPIPLRLVRRRPEPKLGGPKPVSPPRRRALSGTSTSEYPSDRAVKRNSRRHRLIPEPFSFPTSLHLLSTCCSPLVHSDPHILHACSSPRCGRIRWSQMGANRVGPARSVSERGSEIGQGTVQCEDGRHVESKDRNRRGVRHHPA